MHDFIVIISLIIDFISSCSDIFLLLQMYWILEIKQLFKHLINKYKIFTISSTELNKFRWTSYKYTPLILFNNLY